MILCDYGCGQEVKYQFKNGKRCCSKSHNKCSINKRKNSDLHVGKKLTSDHKKRIGLSRIGKYCGKKSPAYGKPGYWRGKKRPEISGDNSPNKRAEVRKKISEANKGRTSHRKGKKLPDKTRRKMSLSCFGELNPNWNGGVSREGYCEEWYNKDLKEFIKQRDGYKCMNPTCYDSVKMLCVHHVNYDKKNCDYKNLITLCISCNSIANYYREWHEAWYKAIIYRRYNENFLVI